MSDETKDTKTIVSSDRVTKVIGHYCIIQKLGEGGMGEVYEAEATEKGRPFFVMECVKGIPITEYCDTHRLNNQHRLDLFLQICEGIQHAHQKGIIHRDFKASNVLITVYDDKPSPKIIDFGVAKAIAQRLSEQTLFTEMGQLIGTPEYMSPEQAEMTGLDIDTRTDVYSLGVLYHIQGKFEDAEPQFKRALTISEKSQEGDHPDVAGSLNNLANLCRNQGKYDQAEPYYVRSETIFKKSLGEEHPYVAHSFREQTNLYRNQENYEKSETLYKKSVEILEKSLGPHHLHVDDTLENYALLLRKTGRVEEAAELDFRARSIRNKD